MFERSTTHSGAVDFEAHDPPRPDQPRWEQRGGTSWTIAAVLLFLSGAGGLALGVATAATSGVGLLLVGSPLLLFAAALVYLSRARRPSRSGLVSQDVPELGGRGVVLPYSAALARVCVAAVGYCALFFGLIAVGGLASATGGGSRGLDGSVVLLIVALATVGYVLWCLADLLRGRLERGFVALTPRGILHRSWAMRAYVPWSCVVAVTTDDVRGPLVHVTAAANASRSWIRQTSRAWRQSELTFAPHLVVQGRFLAVDPAVLYYAARFYHENPGARDELATDRAIARLRAARV